METFLEILIIVAVVAIAIIKRKSIFVKKHIFLLIVLGVITGILYLIFTSHAGSSDALAWWIIGIVGCILIGIAALKFKGNTPLSGLSLPSIKTWKSIGVVAAVIVVCIVGWRWYSHHTESPEKVEAAFRSSLSTIPNAYPNIPTVTFGPSHSFKEGAWYKYYVGYGDKYFFTANDHQTVFKYEKIDDSWWKVQATQDASVWVTPNTINP